MTKKYFYSPTILGVRRFIQDLRQNSVSIEDPKNGEYAQRFGDEICRELYPSCQPSDRPLIRYLLRQIVTDAKAGKYPMGLPWSLEAWVIMLYRIKDLRDVPLLWEAKTINYDSFFGSIDTEYLVGAGVEPTLNYLRSSDEVKNLLRVYKNNEKGQTIIEYIESCVAGNRVSGDHELDDVEPVASSIRNFEDDYRDFLKPRWHERILQYFRL